jgi:hypothetical protein
MLASHENIGGFPKCWRLMKMLADYKMLASSKILAVTQIVGGFTKCWRLAEI